MLHYWVTHNRLSSWNTTADDCRPYRWTSAHSHSDSQLFSNKAIVDWHKKLKRNASYDGFMMSHQSHVVTEQSHAMWESTMKMTGEVDLIARTSLWPSHCVRQLQNLSDRFRFDIPIAKGGQTWRLAFEMLWWKRHNGLDEALSFSCCLSCPVSLVYPHPVLAQNKLTGSTTSVPVCSYSNVNEPKQDNSLNWGFIKPSLA